MFRRRKKEKEKNQEQTKKNQEEENGTDKSKPVKKKPQKKEDVKIAKEKKILEHNAYNLLFDELTFFLKQLPKLSSKDLKQQLILLDGKMLWLEKQTELQLTGGEEVEDVIDVELQMLEMGMDLESADEVKLSMNPSEIKFDLEMVKERISDGDFFDTSLKGLEEDFDLEDLEKPIEELEADFILFDIRTQMEGAINTVFSLEGKIKELDLEKDKEQIKQIRYEQKKAVNRYISNILKKLKKEKPKLILSEKQLKQFKELTKEEIAKLKAQEERSLDKMAEDLLEE
ncbi:MAG: hypothetical protein GF308_02240 [Candidatus Heimdallarchaeota archaeon]|nr:hypothetical protein [Candidatus Heimdallarchaeota archaeon]